MLQQSSVASHVPAVKASALLQAAFAVLLGVMLVGFTGFAHVEAVHNAAHDTRHASGFPCH